ncbi:MAG: Rap1a/Tai family immunity protein [Candidatus Sulfotelmatobacter sp.]
MKQVIVTMLALVVVAPALGKDDWYPVFGPDGNHLIVTCKVALRVLDANPEAEGQTGTNQDAYDEGHCQGLVEGVASNINSEDGADLASARPSTTQLIRVVQKYLEDHPEELSKPAVWLIRVSLIKAFPKKP